MTLNAYYLGFSGLVLFVGNAFSLEINATNNADHIFEAFILLLEDHLAGENTERILTKVAFSRDRRAHNLASSSVS